MAIAATRHTLYDNKWLFTIWIHFESIHATTWPFDHAKAITIFIRRLARCQFIVQHSFHWYHDGEGERDTSHKPFSSNAKIQVIRRSVDASSNSIQLVIWEIQTNVCRSHFMFSVIEALLHHFWSSLQLICPGIKSSKIGLRCFHRLVYIYSDTNHNECTFVFRCYLLTQRLRLRSDALCAKSEANK